ncbi:MAG: CRISPR-associated endonuclease Cas1 [Acidobacteriaceae bacterium]|nr:CRISPR-associated endonuclease Cas1 [Acidobacteriaceae bacterium]MBV9500072.1 CRISPR-associated endonuclease Cas1 [Acidobacteriaceae bacterium]
MSAQLSPLPSLRKPPAAAQFNWITGTVDITPEQIELPLPPLDDAILPADGTVTLLATENGSQLFVSGFGLFIGKKSERVVVKKGKAVCAQVPLMRLQEIVIASRGVSFSSDLLEELCEHGIRIACLTSSGKPFALLTSPMLTATVETRRAQFDAYRNERGADLCRWIVAGKLRNQEKLMRYFGKSRDGERRTALETAADMLRCLRRSALAVEGSDCSEVRPELMGIEGTGGRLYWKQIGNMLPDELGFSGRTHQGATDAVNAALNYGYGILTSHVWGAIMNAGLEPFAGFLHVDRPGKPSLVLDLVEEFRQPVVDRAIFSWLNKGGQLEMERGQLGGAARESVASRVLLRLTSSERHRGKEHQIRSIVQMQSRLAASAVRGLRPYRSFSFKW